MIHTAWSIIQYSFYYYLLRNTGSNAYNTIKYHNINKKKVLSRVKVYYDNLVDIF